MKTKIKKVMRKGEVLFEGMFIAGLIYMVVLKRAWGPSNEERNVKNN